MLQKCCFLFADLRPKGRGRPQRILLGVWPDEHIRGVIRAVVFRDSHQIKDEPPMSYQRMHVSGQNLFFLNFFKNLFQFFKPFLSSFSLKSY